MRSKVNSYNVIEMVLSLLISIVSVSLLKTNLNSGIYLFSGFKKTVVIVFIAALCVYLCLNKGKIIKGDVKIAIISLIFSFIQISSAFFVRYQTLDFKNLCLYINTIGLTIIIYFLFKLIYIFFDKLQSKGKLEKKVMDIVDKLGLKKISIIFFILFFVCWLVFFMADFPGYPSEDGPVMYYWINNGTLNAWHPIVFQYYLFLLIKLGKVVFGSINAGLAVYGLVTGLILTLTKTYICYYMIKRKVPNFIVIVCALFFILNPVINIYAYCTAKESLFGSLLALCTVFTIDIVYKPDIFFKSKFLIIRYIAAVILMCLTRNQGIYIAALMIPFVILAVCKKYKIKASIISVIPVILVYLFLGPLSNMMGIVQSPVKEKLGIPIQQIARTCLDANSHITEEQMDTINEVLPKDAISAYDPMNADLVKAIGGGGGFRSDKFNENPLKYIKTYIAVGLHNPNDYIDAYLAMTYPYVYLGKPQQIFGYPLCWTKEFIKSCVGEEINQTSLLPEFHNFLSNVGLNYTLISVSIANLALPFSVMVIVFGYLIYKKRFRLIVPMLFMFLYLLTCLLGPAALARYCLPLMMGIPIYLTLPFLRSKN